jgi:hypothetical protein
MPPRRGQHARGVLARTRSVTRAFSRRIGGRRGAFLFIFGVIFVLRGEALVRYPLDELETQAVTSAIRLFPLEWWGVLFTASGIVAVARVVVPQCLSRGAEIAGFACLQGIATAWAFAIWLAALSGEGGPLAFRMALAWTLVVGAVALVSGWAEVRDA